MTTCATACVNLTSIFGAHIISLIHTIQHVSHPPPSSKFINFYFEGRNPTMNSLTSFGAATLCVCDCRFSLDDLCTAVSKWFSAAWKDVSSSQQCDQSCCLLPTGLFPANRGLINNSEVWSSQKPQKHAESPGAAELGPKKEPKEFWFKKKKKKGKSVDKTKSLGMFADRLMEKALL